MSDLWQEVSRPRPRLAHAGAYGCEAVSLSSLRQDVSTADRSGTTCADPHGQETLHLRYLRTGVRSEARSDLSQEKTSRPAASVTGGLHQKHRNGIHEGIRDKKYGHQGRIEGTRERERERTKESSCCFK